MHSWTHIWDNLYTLENYYQKVLEDDIMVEHMLSAVSSVTMQEGQKICHHYILTVAVKELAL